MACGPRRKMRARGRRTRSRVLLGHGGEGDPDGRAPHVSERERRGRDGLGQEKGRAGGESWAGGEKVSGRKKKRRREIWVAGKKKGKEKGWAG